MFVLLVHLHVKPEHIEQFRQATMENGSSSRQEPGIVRFDVIQETEDPTRFVLLEVYRAREAQAQHRETAHYQVWAAKVADWLAERRTRATYFTVDPPDQEW